MQDKKIETILKLLAQAEGTNNEEEAKAYTERAQHLATINAIELEMVYARQKDKVTREEPTVKTVKVGEPGREHKNRFWVDLYLGIARSNDIRSTISHDRANCHAYGYPSDIEVTEILFASLNTQMVSLANEALRKGEHRALGVHGRTFRNNFYEGFVRTIEDRLYKARNDALAEQRKRDEEIAERLAPVLKDAAAVPDLGDEPVITGALVMVKKTEAVNEYYASKTRGVVRGSYRSYGAGTKHYGAQRAGSQAGQSARIGNQGAVGGHKKAIG